MPRACVCLTSVRGRRAFLAVLRRNQNRIHEDQRLRRDNVVSTRDSNPVRPGAARKADLRRSP